MNSNSAFPGKQPPAARRETFTPVPNPGVNEVTRISSASLLLGKNEIEIDHGGAIYRLRRTSLGKLILTK